MTMRRRSGHSGRVGSRPTRICDATVCDCVLAATTIADAASARTYDLVIDRQPIEVEPGRKDGSPGFNSFAGIKPGETYNCSFNLRQGGTYWYHAHCPADTR
jgi:hypothetical protein